MLRPRLPNFFLVGTGKAGTTSLHRYLSQHPQVYMSPVKEPCFFAAEIRAENLTPEFQRHSRLQARALRQHIHDGKPFHPYGWLAHTWEDYLRLFQDAREESAIGEASAAYLWSSSAAANIYACVPDARIVMILRDPSERAFSQYLHQTTVGFTRASFRETIELGTRGNQRKIGPLYPFLEAGLYYKQVKRFLDVFPRERIRIYWYEEDWRRPARLLADLFGFLGVDASFQPDLSSRDHERRTPRWIRTHYLLKKFKVWYPLRGMVPGSLQSGLKSLAFRQGRSVAMDPADRRYLIDYYREDVRMLSSLLDRDLSSWLN